MKKVILTIATTLSVLTSFSQNRVWVTIPNLESARLEMSTMNITSIEKAFPSSRNEKLQNVYEIQTSEPSTVMVETLKRSNGLFVNPEIGPEYQTLEVPNDYFLSSQGQWALDMINASEVWDITKGSSDVTIAITDANYHLNHEDLAGKYDHVSPNFNTNYTHGTAVAVIAGGNTNNWAGTSSIGYDSRLQLRAMNYNELLEATYSGAKVINASWASGCYFSTYGQDVINEVYNNGSVVVASAGNGTTCNGASNLVYPASYDHVISVTSVGPMDNHERFIGNPSITHQHNSMVDICAPGYDVPLTTAPGQYMTGTGTSFASPYVSGTIALMLSVNPCLTVNDIEYILKQTSDTNVLFLNPQYQGQLGSGRLDALRAVEMAREYKTMNGELVETVNCELGVKILSVVNLDGVGGYEYTWNGETQPESIVVENSGVYKVIVQDSNGCVFSQSIYSDKYSKIDYDSVVTNVSCFGMSDGQIIVNISGGSDVMDPSWNNNQIGHTISNLSNGDYIFTVVDRFDCVLTDTLTITQPEVLTSEITYTNPTMTTNGSVDIIVNGGTLPYTYEWNNGSTTEDLNDISEGFYELLITDANGCMSSENVVLNTEEENTSSVDELTSDELLVYPNPSNGYVTIKKGKDNDCNLTITSVNGQTVVTNKTFNGETTVNGLSDGIYLVTVDNMTQKLVVK